MYLFVTDGYMDLFSLFIFQAEEEPVAVSDEFVFTVVTS
jgi:hypothetical protein